MLTIATGVFTAVDVGEAIVSQKYWLSINYVGVGRFAVAIGEDVAWCLKGRNVKKIKKMYEHIKRFTYTQTEENINKRIGADMNIDKLRITSYNVCYTKLLRRRIQNKAHSGK